MKWIQIRLIFDQFFYLMDLRPNQQVQGFIFSGQKEGQCVVSENFYALTLEFALVGTLPSRNFHFDHIHPFKNNAYETPIRISSFCSDGGMVILKSTATS